MSLTPGYGETPVTDDELDALTPSARELLGLPVTKAAVYDLEQGIQVGVVDELLACVLDGDRAVDDLLTDHFCRDLHQRLYGDIWQWAGRFRRRELNIGVAPEQIAVELRICLDNLRYRWAGTADWTARQLGIAAHAEVVRIHPFTDGNGRMTRLLGDLVFVAAQGSPDPDLYDWHLDKRRYIELLREYDRHRDPCSLAEFVCTRPIGE